MMNKDFDLPTLSDILASLHGPVDQLIVEALSPEQRLAIIDRGHFRPTEDEALASWLAKLLSVRSELWGIISAVDKIAAVPFRKIKTIEHWRCFVIGYTAACLLVRLDRFFLWEFATHKLIQRKLNESFLEYRIPAKSFTDIFQRYTEPGLAFRLYEATWFSRIRSRKIRKLENDDLVGMFARDRKKYELYLDKSKRNYFNRTWMFFRHTFRRRIASAKQKTMFAVIEKLGRAASDIAIDNEKRVTAAIQNELKGLLQPGDILVTRHKYAITNLFLPGFWPHAALYVGTDAQREELGVSISHAIKEKWVGDICTLEALKDGVRLRALSETLHVDSCVVLRPVLSADGVRQGLERIIKHEGKRYNFDFDFFRSDRLVCTEVIYRAFDGVENLEFELVERAGRESVSAEDFLDKAINKDGLELLALFGYPSKSSTLITGPRARELLLQSYDSPTTTRNRGPTP